MLKIIVECVVGSSPRVRSGHEIIGRVVPDDGIISACAERSGLRSASPAWRRDHLRVCGAVRA